MNTVLLDQLVEKFNSLDKDLKLESFNTVSPEGRVQVGLIAKDRSVSDDTEFVFIKIEGTQTVDTPYLELVEIGAGHIIDSIFRRGIEDIDREINIQLDAIHNDKELE